MFRNHNKTLLKASENGDLEKAKRALRNGANIETKGKADGFTPLHFASYKGHEAVISLLLENGTNINAKGDDGSTPLHAASSKGHEAIVALLLENGADCSITNKKGKTPLQVAQDQEQRACVVVIERFIRLHEKTPKQDAIVRKQESGKEANMNGFDSSSAMTTAQMKRHEWSANNEMVTPLHKASEHGNESVVISMLEKGANVHARSKWGDTPLHMASEYGHGSIVSILLESGANVNVKNNFGSTPLHDASSKGHEAVVSVLLDNGADHTMINNAGKTPLQLALSKQNSSCAQLIKNLSTIEKLDECCKG